MDLDGRHGPRVGLCLDGDSLVAIRSRPGVRYEIITPRGLAILGVIMQMSQAMGRDVEITSACDSHSLPDPHARGEAYDISVKGFTEEELLVAHRLMAGRLGAAYTVLYEVPERPAGPLADMAYVNPHATGPHWHVQVKKGS